MAHGCDKTSNGTTNGHACEAPAVFEAAAVQRRLAYAAKHARDRVTQHKGFFVLIRNAKRCAKGHAPDSKRRHRRGDKDERVRSHAHKLRVGER